MKMAPHCGAIFSSTVYRAHRRAQRVRSQMGIQPLQQLLEWLQTFWATFQANAIVWFLLPRRRWSQMKVRRDSGCNQVCEQADWNPEHLRTSQHIWNRAATYRTEVCPVAAWLLKGADSFLTGHPAEVRSLDKRSGIGRW